MIHLPKKPLVVTYDAPDVQLISSHLNLAAIAPRAAEEKLSVCADTEGETESAELLLALDGGDQLEGGRVVHAHQADLGPVPARVRGGTHDQGLKVPGSA